LKLFRLFACRQCRIVLASAGQDVSRFPGRFFDQIP
jgi:hypothetical protein